jgi:hypothetical protein
VGIDKVNKGALIRRPGQGATQNEADKKTSEMNQR